jgi:hypothetical protein
MVLPHHLLLLYCVCACASLLRYQGLPWCCLRLLCWWQQCCCSGGGCATPTPAEPLLNGLAVKTFVATVFQRCVQSAAADDRWLRHSMKGDVFRVQRC